MTTRNTLRDRIADRIGFRSDQNTRIVNQMALVQETVLEQARFLPWFLRVVDDTISVSANSRSASLPTGFLRWDDNYGVWLYDSTLSAENRFVQRLRRGDFKALYNEYGETEGDPEAYDFDESNIYVFPKAGDNGATLNVGYFKRETSVSTGDIENNWLTYAEDLFEAETVMRMARILRDRELLNEAADERIRALQRLHDHHVMRDVADGGRQMGGED